MASLVRQKLPVPSTQENRSLQTWETRLLQLTRRIPLEQRRAGTPGATGKDGPKM
jgi:hypothetical protein